MPVPASVEFGALRETFNYGGAQVATVVIAAPGVGSRIRILGFHMSGAGALTFATSVIQVVGLAAGATEDTRTPYGDPGIGIDGGDNEALTLDSPGAVAGEILYVVV